MFAKTIGVFKVFMIRVPSFYSLLFVLLILDFVIDETFCALLFFYWNITFLPWKDVSPIFIKFVAFLIFWCIKKVSLFVCVPRDYLALRGKYRFYYWCECELDERQMKDEPLLFGQKIW